MLSDDIRLKSLSSDVSENVLLELCYDYALRLNLVLCLDSVDDAYLGFSPSRFICSLRTQRYGLRFHSVFLEFSIATRA